MTRYYRRLQQTSAPSAKFHVSES